MRTGSSLFTPVDFSSSSESSEEELASLSEELAYALNNLNKSSSKFST
tara:strand:- start:1248 stop:1391 length:144 start_codon:yes stop_codon:yes gene_type:complete